MGENANNTTALATVERGEIQRASEFQPVMSIQEAIARFNAVKEFVKGVMRPTVDFGAIPGTGDKPTLLKPGAEKLCTLFGLRPKFIILEKTEDWERGLFYYLYKCELWRGDICIAEGDGSANSFEKKYRWRTVSDYKATPEEKQRAVRCETRRGKGNSTYKVYVLENDDPYTLINTLQKMAQKRALVAATLIGVNASEFFTQDVEDMVDTTYTDAGSDHYDAAPSGPSPEETEAKVRRDRIEKVREAVKPYHADAIGCLIAMKALSPGQDVDVLLDKHLIKILSDTGKFKTAVEQWKAQQAQQQAPQQAAPASDPDAEGAQQDAEVLPDLSEPGWKQVLLEKIETKTGTKKNGQSWTRWAAYDGTDWYGTFSSTIGAQLEQAQAAGKAIFIKVKEEGDHLNIEEAWQG